MLFGAPMLPSDDVFDVKRECREIVLMEKTVFATIPGTLADMDANGGPHRKRSR